MTMKVCKTCGHPKPTNEFPKNRLTRDGFGAKCKTHQNEYARSQYAKNAERVNRLRKEKKENPERRLRLNWQAREAYMEHQRFRKKAKEYDISEEEAQRLLSGVCNVCGKSPDPNHPGTAQRSLHIDHDHITKRVRGALCHSCNAGIGRFHDSSELLRKAANYLDRLPVPR